MKISYFLALKHEYQYTNFTTVKVNITSKNQVTKEVCITGLSRIE